MYDGRRRVVRPPLEGGALPAKARPHGPAAWLRPYEDYFAETAERDPRRALVMAVLFYCGPREPEGPPGA